MITNAQINKKNTHLPMIKKYLYSFSNIKIVCLSNQDKSRIGLKIYAKQMCVKKVSILKQFRF